MIDNFHSETLSKEDIVQEIEKDVKELFSYSCYEIEVTQVQMYDDKTVKIKFEGDDAALLIGKEGYRYKALSYMLFNWINPKYNLLLRLEIAEFLKMQEEQIKKYLEPIKESIYKFGKGQTKPLDGVLVQIALKELRGEFPNKYVAIKTNSNGDKYIIVNEFTQTNNDK
jgi:spoIIIJ-associated protein